MLSFLQQLNREGNTIVLITHDNSIAVRAQRIIRLQDGRIIYDGPPTTHGLWFSLPRQERGYALMGMEQNFKLAVKSLMSSKARAILTMLGIIIGVAR